MGVYKSSDVPERRQPFLVIAKFVFYLNVGSCSKVISYFQKRTLLDDLGKNEGTRWSGEATHINNKKIQTFIACIILTDTT